MARRAKGEGSVHRDGDGYRASVPLPPDRDGKRRRLSRRARTKTDAAALLPQLRAEAGLAGEDETLPDFLDRWHRASSRDWSERNQDSVRVIIDKHLVPVLGRVQLRDLTRDHVQRLIDQKLPEGLRNQTVRHIHTQLHSALGERYAPGDHRPQRRQVGPTAENRRAPHRTRGTRPGPGAARSCGR